MLPCVVRKLAKPAVVRTGKKRIGSEKCLSWPSHPNGCSSLGVFLHVERDIGRRIAPT